MMAGHHLYIYLHLNTNQVPGSRLSGSNVFRHIKVYHTYHQLPTHDVAARNVNYLFTYFHKISAKVVRKCVLIDWVFINYQLIVNCYLK